MATINSSFKRRMDDMFSVSTPRSQKRKFSNTTFSTPSESHILIPFEKRKKIAQWEEFPPRNGTRAELFPSSVQPVFRNYNHTNGNILGAFSPRPQASPQALPSTVTPILNGIISAPVSPPHVVVNPGRVYKGSLLSRRDSGPLSLALSRTVRDSTVNGHIIPHVDEDLEKEALRRQNKKSMELNRDLMEALERARAKELKDAAELQQFKELFRTIKNADLAQESQNMSGQREGLGFLPREEFRAISSGSFFRDLLVSDGSVSRSGSLLDEGIVASGGSGGERLQDPEWKELWNKVKEPSRIEKEASLEKEIEYTQSKLLALQLERTSKLKAEKKPEDKTLVDAFTPLSAEADEAVDEALGGGERYEILVTHEKSNIDVTRGIMQCLSPGVWLNDEVINVYMELLKEREVREPDRFLKCHFFNTFFYNKLFKDKRSYDYKAIRRWTTQKKLGYSLSDCDKILVPIHQEIHWCLAVINIRDKRLEYLDSLKGGDRLVLDNLARYIADEAKDKDGKVLDASTWDQDFPKDIPEQLNGCDCGMFMVKYADFHSRGAPLQFSQEHMEYFRRKMVWEILDLQAT